jgi:hypothetical protein
VVVKSTEQVSAQTANLSKNLRSQSTWLLLILKEEHLGMVIIYLLFFQFVIHLSGGWIYSGANIYVCADVSLFASYQVGRAGALLMGNGSRVHVLGSGTVNLKFTLGKTVLLKNVQHVPSIKKNLISGSMMCRDGYKIVLESNKYVVSRHGTFIGKGYDCGDLFGLSLLDVCNKIVNIANISDESGLWHSRLCHVNFGCLMRLANLNLISKINVVKSSKCHACV